jgi:hypothetical protein
MQTTSRSNRDALMQAIDIYRDAMRPFIIRQLRRVQGASVEELIERGLGDRQADEFYRRLDENGDIESAIDLNYFPKIFRDNWRAAFAQQFNDDPSVQNMLWLIKTARDQIAHPGRQDIEAEYTRVHLYHIADLLGRINAPDEKQAVEEIRDNLFASAESGEQADSMPLDEGSQIRDGQDTLQRRSSNNLTPWREVIHPNNDVALGTFEAAEFAADLQQVHDGRADATGYGNPVGFFNQTYITPGIRKLLVNTLRRLGGNGGDPVIQTKTGFGGGKTHSLIALYHLVKNTDALINPPPDREDHQRTGEEIKGIMQEGEWQPTPDRQPRVAVLDGTFLAATDPAVTKETNDPLNTLWGVMAYQLGGQDAYELVGEAARGGTAPGGSQLDRLLEHVGPCVILMDELVAYVRNAGEAQDNIYTFMQVLTQSVRRSNNATLVVTLPESVVEAGAEGGVEALSRLDSILGRIEAVWEPLEVHEAFEVVRRRLFGRVRDEAARDQVCETFSRMYANARRDYPEEVSEPRYLERMKACYPIHPEIFDRLYSDWSSIPRFQRTRAVLRMMANCINRLYLREDPSPLIMPANLTLSDPELSNEFLPLLDGEWRPVLTEVDSDGSRTDNIDRNVQRFSNIGGAARRIARTVFLGSASSGAVRGIDARRIHLGVVLPGQGVSVYKEALGQMNGALYYLYSSDDRYYFHAEENLNKVATDRADTLSEREVEECIIAQLQEAARGGRQRRGEVLVCPQNSDDVRDVDTVQLVILPSSKALPNRSRENDEAAAAAQDILLNRGDAPRIHRNGLLFLAARNDEIRTLRSSARTYLAWHSILNGDRRIANLTGDRLNQASSSLRSADRQLSEALVRAYRWAMVPSQENPQRANYGLSIFQTNPADTGDIVDSALGQLIEAEVLVDEISPSALTTMLQQYVWSSQNYSDHIGVDNLWELMTRNVYLHRLRSKNVLIKCITQGVSDGKFGYAEAYNGEEYEGMCFGETTSNLLLTDRDSGVLVTPEMAQLVIEEGTRIIDSDGSTSDELDDQEVDLPPAGPKRIVVTKTIQNDISLDDINLLRDEIIRNLSADSGEITVKITITANKSEGFSESTARAVRDNSDQLGLGFEQS